MKRIKNRLGFTLIELLAVIVIMGILMMIAIPAITKYITQSRQDAFLDTAKSYINAVRYAYLNDELTCTQYNEAGSVSQVTGTEVGVPNEFWVWLKPEFLEKGGYSPWGNDNITGWIHVQIANDGTGTYSILISDSKGHGIEGKNTNEYVKENDLSRDFVKTSGIQKYGYFTNGGGKIQCKLK